MRAALFALAGALFVAGTASAQDLTAAAEAAGCPGQRGSDGRTFAATEARLQAAPADLGGGWVYAGLTSDEEGRTATLCVALLDRMDNRYVRVAAGTAQVEANASPSRFWPSIEANGYPLAPGVMALGVSADAELNTTSISAGSLTFVLFKPAGRRLVPIFDTLVGEEHYDKVRERRYGPSVSCDLSLEDRATRGMRNLTVTCKRRRTTYRWTGERYEAAVR